MGVIVVDSFFGEIGNGGTFWAVPIAKKMRADMNMFWLQE